jgi:hypothetical protein
MGITAIWFRGRMNPSGNTRRFLKCTQAASAAFGQLVIKRRTRPSPGADDKPRPIAFTGRVGALR